MSDAGLVVAGVTRNSIRDSATWVKRLGLPYSVLTDVEGEAGRAFGIVRSVGIGTWKIEFFRRSTFLADLHGTVSAVWRDVKVRGHAQEILAVARALPRVQP